MNLTDAGDTIVKEITIKGSAERVFEALTNPDQRMKWWAPRVDFRQRTWSLTCAPAADG
jgi:uncharacterized protein YndB with AHSA1/START domain